MLNQLAANVLRGARLDAVRSGDGWAVRCNGLVLVGIAGGEFSFASADNALDWVKSAVERYLAGNQKADKVHAYIGKLEVLRLKAVASGKLELAQSLRGEIEALSALDYTTPLCGGGGAWVGSYVYCDGGGA
jgi:hypothetical protein